MDISQSSLEIKSASATEGKHPELSGILEELLFRAGIEAAELHHEKVEPGHLLIGILAMPINPARSTLESRGVTIEKLRLVVAGKYPWHTDKSDYCVEQWSDEAIGVLLATNRLVAKVATAGIDHLLRALIGNDGTMQCNEVIKLILDDLPVDSKDALGRLNHEMAG